MVEHLELGVRWLTKSLGAFDGTTNVHFTYLLASNIATVGEVHDDEWFNHVDYTPRTSDTGRGPGTHTYDADEHREGPEAHQGISSESYIPVGLFYFPLHGRTISALIARVLSALLESRILGTLILKGSSYRLNLFKRRCTMVRNSSYEGQVRGMQA